MLRANFLCCCWLERPHEFGELECLFEHWTHVLQAAKVIEKGEQLQQLLVTLVVELGAAAQNRENEGKRVRPRVKSELACALLLSRSCVSLSSTDPRFDRHAIIQLVSKCLNRVIQNHHGLERPA